MLFSRYGPWKTGLVALAGLAAAGPVAMDVGAPLNQAATELMIREALAEAIHTPHLEKRLSSDFSMEKSWKNEVLFSGYGAPGHRGVRDGFAYQGYGAAPGSITTTTWPRVYRWPSLASTATPKVLLRLPSRTSRS